MLKKKISWFTPSRQKKRYVGKNSPWLRVSICFFSTVKREFSLATPSSLQKGGFYNCEGFDRHVITKDKKSLGL